MTKPNLRITGKEERKRIPAKSPEISFNKAIKEKFPNLNEVMPINIQETY